MTAEAEPRSAAVRLWVGVGACALIGAFALRGRPVPLLSLVNLGFHELAHLLTYPFPDLFTAAMGSIGALLVPSGLAAYFTWGHRDRLGAAVCLAWAGSAAAEWAVYVADAPFERLPLLGGGEHDWAFVLGRLGWIEAADEIALAIRVVAWALVLGGVAVCVHGLVVRPKPTPVPAVISSRQISWD